MAVYTFAQRAILLEDRGQPEIDVAVRSSCSPLSVIKVALYKISADIFNGDLTINTTVGGVVNYLQVNGVSALQLKQFARNVRDSGRYMNAFIQVILDEPTYINSLNGGSTEEQKDNKLKVCIQKMIPVYAKDIVI